MLTASPRNLEEWRPNAPCQAPQSSCLLLGAWQVVTRFFATIIIALYKKRVKSAIGSYQPSSKENLPRASVESEPTEAKPTWCSSSVNSRKNSNNKTRDSMLLLSASQKLLTVSRTGLWPILKQFGCPPIFYQW